MTYRGLIAEAGLLGLLAASIIGPATADIVPGELLVGVKPEIDPAQP